MSIKSQGGVFGRNPTFNDVTVDGDLSIAGTLSVGGETITGLSYQGGWNADTNTPDIAASSPVTGQFWIVSTDGSTDVGGITNWTSGDWALYDGTNWQRVEGGNTDLTTGVVGQLAVANGGTGAADASTARTNLGLAIGVDVEGVDATILRSADIGASVQGYDADTAKYDDTTANFTGTLQNGGSNVVVDSDIGSTVEAYDATILKSADIGSTVQAYDADTAKLDVAQTWSAAQALDSGITIGDGKANLISDDLYIGTGDTCIRFDDANDAIRPAGTTGSSRTNAISLGDDTRRFTNLYLTGNVVLDSGSGIDFSATSGTGTSELFDDYEEGTWTPTYAPEVGSFNALTMDVVSATYTKIGRTVIANCFIRTDNVDTTGKTANLLLISGLPFTSTSSINSVGNITNATQWAGDTPLSAFVSTSSQNIYLMYRTSVNGADNYLLCGDMTSGVNADKNRLILTVIYEAS